MMYKPQLIFTDLGHLNDGLIILIYFYSHFLCKSKRPDLDKVTLPTHIQYGTEKFISIL